MIKVDGGIITNHFDIFDDVCILDLPTEKGWLLMTYQNHRLKEVDKWYF